jgi:hypothetical protein
MEPEVCVHCDASDSEKTLIKCPMCHQRTCEACCYKRGGKVFCHVNCADEFFFGADEDDV